MKNPAQFWVKINIEASERQCHLRYAAVARCGIEWLHQFSGQREQHRDERIHENAALAFADKEVLNMPIQSNIKLSSVFALVVLLGTATSASAERVWENLAIQLNSGGYIWATLDYESSCGYSLLVGSNDTNISGNASNCTQDANGYWALHACGSQDSGFHGEPEDVINEIIRRCN